MYGFLFVGPKKKQQQWHGQFRKKNWFGEMKNDQNENQKKKTKKTTENNYNEYY